MLLDLNGKTALVTGCRRGLGRAMAEGLARSGADIVGVSRHLIDSDDVVTEVRRTGRSFTGHQVDLSDREATLAFIAECPDVDILVNNAGAIARTTAADMDPEAWDSQIEINLTSQFLLSRHHGARMAQRGHGKIISIASVLSFSGGIKTPGYAVTKTAILGMTRALCNEWAAQGVNVNAIAPGYYETDMTSALQQDEERRKALSERIPAGRWGRPEDLVGAVVFLASSASDYVNGTVLAVDGGWLAR